MKGILFESIETDLHSIYIAIMDFKAAAITRRSCIRPKHSYFRLIPCPRSHCFLPLTAQVALYTHK